MTDDTLVFQIDFDADQINYELIIAACNQLDHLGLEEKSNRILLYVEASKVDQQNITEVLAAFGLNEFVDISHKTVQDQNWNKIWENHFAPILIDNQVYIRAEFHAPKPDLQEIIIQPKMAFGTGHHATTQAMIQLMIQIKFQNKQVLDMGCGTGVLGIFALKSKAENVNFVDNDQWCYQNTIDNLEKNQLEPQQVQLADRLAHNTCYDVILANIQRNVILDQIADYNIHLKDKGLLLVSGFYEKDVRLIIDKAIKYGLQLVDKRVINEWCALKLKKS